MSHIGKKIIKVSSVVSIKQLNQTLIFSSKLGFAQILLPEQLKVEINSDSLRLMSEDSEKLTNSKQRIQNKVKSLWGTYRSLINNTVIGLSRGYTVKLELVGIGYRVIKENQHLMLKLGFSHNVIYQIPSDLSITCPKPTIITIFGINKQRVHQIASDIRKLREPDVYKGKGIRYHGEHLILKEGKKNKK